MTALAGEQDQDNCQTVAFANTKPAAASELVASVTSSLAVRPSSVMTHTIDPFSTGMKNPSFAANSEAPSLCTSEVC
jgi:hypothetical protein